MIVISGNEMEEAEVVWYNPQKRYGFAKVRGTKEEIFFHFNDGRLINNDDKLEQAIFTTSQRYLLGEPIIGEQILFVRALGKQGKFKASPWVHFDDWLYVDTFLTDLNFVCSCGHKKKDHSGGQCMICNCGHEEFESFNDPEIFRVVSHSDSPGGFELCQ